jgi:DNA-binding LytR/AlgR family response regulator
MDCIIIDDDEMSRETLRQMISQIDDLFLIKAFADPLEALTFLKKETVDLIFLDVEMPNITGLELLNTLEGTWNVILISSHKQYAIDAFEYNVVDYLVKPVKLPRLIKAIGKARSNTDNLAISTGKGAQEYFFIKKNSVLNKVPSKDILWIEALGDYVTVHTADKKYILHITLKSLEDKLPEDKFVRVHRSYIVHVNNIRAVEGTTIFITDTPIPLGAIYKDKFMNRLNLLS